MPLAIPYLVPYANAAGIVIGSVASAVGLIALSDKVQDYMEENPENSMKILAMIMPEQGIAALFNKEAGDEVEVEGEVEVEEKPKKLSGKEKGERIKAAIKRARAGRGNYSSPDAEGPAVDIRGSVIREVEDMGIADKGLKDKPYKKSGFNWKRFTRNKADGGRIGFEVGGLSSQAQSIYDSWIAAGHTEEDVLAYLTSQGLYGDQEAEGIETIVNTAPAVGGGDGQTGFGLFGDLDKSSKKTVMLDRWSEELGTAIPQPTDIYQNSSGMWKTYDNLNPYHGGINAKPLIGGILESVMGIDQDPTKFKEGQIMGTFNKWDRPWAPDYKNLSFIQKMKTDHQRNKDLKDMQNKITADRIAREADLANIQQIQQHTGQPLSQYRMDRPASERQFTGAAPKGTTTFDTKSGMGRRDYGDGGLATMFQRRR